MGGGGGSGFPIGPTDIDQLRERARQIARQATHDAEVNDLLREGLKELNDRDVAKVGRHLDEIVEALSAEIKDVERTFFGGSVAKNTFVDGLSDVDALVEIKGDLEHDSPEQVREKFRAVLSERLGGSNVEDVSAGALAVTVRYSDGTEIQLLPAIQRSEGLSISSQDGSTWKAIHPRTFAHDLTRTNQHLGGALIPAIKLAKAVIAEQIPEGERPSGYHVEALAVTAFADYPGARNPKAMLTQLFSSAASNVLKPIKDVSNQSPHVDESLGGANSTDRRSLSARLQRIASNMENSRSVDDWRKLVGDE